MKGINFNSSIYRHAQCVWIFWQLAWPVGAETQRSINIAKKANETGAKPSYADVAAKSISTRLL